VLAVEQTDHDLVRHQTKLTAFVPKLAMSGDTLLILAADEIVMDCNAVLGPIDAQVSQ
jgi:ClpP class serine protease